jgi:cyclophilin family peptidyl-prolyl cis-trans isomerase
MSACGEKDYLVVIHTKYGDMKAILYDETPKHKENFVKLVKDGFYDSLIFHRVIQGFMIQGGDPDSRNANPGQRLGSGGPGYTIPAEIRPEFFHEKGALSAARLSDQINPDKESSGSQFYIVQGQTYAPDQLNADNVKYGKMVGLLNRMFYEGKNPELLQEFIALQQAGDMEALKRKTFESLSIIEQEYGKQTFPEISSRQIEAYTKNGGALHLDGEYSVFGKVVEGLDVIDKIAAVPTDQSERPTTDIIMIITLEEITKKEIARKYGYSYSEN